MSLTRRQLLGRGAAGLGLVAIGDLGVFFDGRPASALAAGGIGPLEDDPAGVLDLPRGFSYEILTRSGMALPGGGVVPGGFDGAAAFRGPRGGVRLVTNHELGGSAAFPALAAPELTYDPGAKGGTTTLTLDHSNRRVDEYVSLAGTFSNCAGGATPWGTWLTCEETEQRANATFGRNHGYVFEVDPSNPANNTTPTPLTALGRYAHEAACVDPRTGSLLLTEDASNPNGLVYRFTPNDAGGGFGSLRAGGVLEAMRASRGGTHVPELSVFTQPGERLDLSWAAVPDPQATSLSVRKQFADAEVTRSRKFEGAWWSSTERAAFIVCSFARIGDGSAAEHDGQVWRLDPDAQTLELVVRFAVNADPGSDAPDGPDNITVCPWGGLFLAEDGGGVQHLLHVDRGGDTHPFARNAINEEEFAGVCFSPDHQTMFCSIQTPGITFAITGPFSRLLVT